MAELIFVTGGARSGKSSFALRLAQERAGDGVTFVATAEAHDDEMRGRIERHRLERPATWTTVEAPDDAAVAIAAASSRATILDCLSLLVSNWLLAGHDEAAILERAQGLLGACQRAGGTLVLVSNEVGSGVVPEYELGRTYRDALGRVNQLFAGASHEAFLIVAGLPLRLK